MIKYHPSLELLQAFVHGELPASLAAGIAIHADMCPKCQAQIAQLTEQVAEASFEERYLDRFIVDDTDDIDIQTSFDINGMIDSITANNDLDVAQSKAQKTIAYHNKQYLLPKVLNNMEFSATSCIGKLSRTRLQLDEQEIRTSLLHIAPGGSVPAHTHKGFELTLLLDGSFHDEHDEYVKGDFIMLDQRNTHHPESPKGCLCYTIANDALHFTEGFNKLLNPIGSLIY